MNIVSRTDADWWILDRGYPLTRKCFLKNIKLNIKFKKVFFCEKVNIFLKNRIF